MPISQPDHPTLSHGGEVMDHATPNGEIDRFSELPVDVIIHILSFLPTKLAARTSLLARRFRSLWETCPALELNIVDFIHLPSSNLVDLADRTLLHRNPPSPLHSLSLCPDTVERRSRAVTSSYISSLLDKAASLGLLHLTVELGSDKLLTVLPLILSISSLEFLSLSFHPMLSGHCQLLTLGSHVISSPVTLTNLKSLSIVCELAPAFYSDELNWLLPQLNALEDLNLNQQYRAGKAELKSTSVKRLKLVMSCQYLTISAPSLEFIEFKAELSVVLRNFHGHMPLLRKAVMQFHGVHLRNVPAIFKMLMAVSHVEELHLDIAQNFNQNYIFHAFLVPSVDPPTFIKLKHFHLEICFHELNLVDLVTIIKHSPALESLRLVHKPPTSRYSTRRHFLKSMLPQNAEGNHRHAYFKDLHIEGKKDELLRKLIGKPSSKEGET